MDFRLTDDQKDLRRGMRTLLDGRFGRDALRAAVDRSEDGGGTESGGRTESGGTVLDRALWRELGAAGLFALRLPEEDGGAGLGLPEAVLLFEEAGRALLPGPLVATHLAAGTVAGAADGETVVTAVDAGMVEWLAEADHVLGDPTDAVSLRSVDPLTPLHRVPGPHTVQHTPHAGTAALLTAALQLGSAGRTLDMAVAHAREREQFGRPVGAFQAVKHLCAEMLVRTETARSAVYAAAVTDEPSAVAAAKLLADEAAVDNARDCLQVHGGMGFTWEADVHLHLERAWVRASQWQRAADAEEELAAAL